LKNDTLALRNSVASMYVSSHHKIKAQILTPLEMNLSWSGLTLQQPT
jgi:hypothetical protein